MAATLVNYLPGESNEPGITIILHERSEVNFLFAEHVTTHKVIV